MLSFANQTFFSKQLIRYPNLKIIFETGPSNAATNHAFQRAEDGDGSFVVETFRSQVRMNTQMMAQIGSLRKGYDKMVKERDFYKLKYSTANDQLTYLKKVTKKNTQDKNADPNKVGQKEGARTRTTTNHD